jgi:glyoxylase-like metal-dependent hydrolase (beta-lactamase superfamily II)
MFRRRAQSGSTGSTVDSEIDDDRAAGFDDDDEFGDSDLGDNDLGDNDLGDTGMGDTGMGDDEPDDGDVRIDLVAGTANTWIVGDADEVIVIDAGDNADATMEGVGDRVVLAVICTHGHAAHAAAAVEVAARDQAPVALHAGDRSAWRELHGSPPEIDVEDGGTFQVAGVTLEVLHAPGHSRGSVVLYCEDLEVAFTGDVVTETGPVARDDGFPNWGRQLDAIGATVLTLPAKTRLLPGHGAELTVATAEKNFNSWVSAGQDHSVGTVAQDEV